MELGFIVPSGKQNYQPFRNQPITHLYLLTILEDYFGDRLDVSLIDLRGVPEENAIYHIPEKDVYFYSVNSPEFLETQSIVEAIRKVYPRSKHIAGGPHIQIFPEDSLLTFDAISLGEAEESVKRIVKDLFESNLKKIYRQQELIDFSSYPYPSRKYLVKSAAVTVGLMGGEYLRLRGTTALFSRGCPFNCHFCANQVHGSLRFRSSELITQEIEYLKREYGVEALAIKDDQSIPVNTKIAQPVLEAIGETGVKWRGQSRANGVHPDMVRLAKQAGCIGIAVGVESVSQKVLDIVNKKIDIVKAKEYLQLLKKEGIDTRLLLIMGLPGEPDDIAEKTIDFIKEAQPSSVLLSFFCPLPGSEIYRNPERFGMRINPNISFAEYITTFGRFDEKERPISVFDYAPVTPFGKGKSSSQIIEDYMTVQSFLRENKLNF